MIIKPKAKNFICTTAHPEGCKESVYQQIQYIKSQPKTNCNNFLKTILEN